MVSSVYTINRHEVVINPDQVPTFTQATRNTLHGIIQSLPKNMPIPLPLVDTTMKGRIQTMQGTIPLLNDATDHRTRDLLVAVLKTAFVAACIAGCFYGGVGFLGLSSLDAFLVTFAPYFISTAVLGGFTWQNIFNIEERRPGNDSFDFYIAEGHIGLSFFIWPILPLYEAATRKSRLEGVVQEQKADIQNQINIGYQLITHPGLLKKLNSKIQKRLLAADAKSQNELAILRNLQTKLKEAREFYERALGIAP